MPPTPQQVFRATLTPGERKVVRSLRSPIDIQLLMDEMRYSAAETYRSPIQVLRDRQAHCYDGAVFAAAMLSLIGFQPLIVNMFPNDRDDEHLVALFWKNRAWGALGQSNFVGLRYREPIHRTLRELMISYFEQYYNVAGEKTLRSYTRPLRLTSGRFGEWMTDGAAMDRIAEHLEQMRRHPLLTPSMVRGLARVDARSYAAGLQGSIPEGLFKPTSSPSSPSEGSSRRSG